MLQWLNKLRILRSGKKDVERGYAAPTLRDPYRDIAILPALGQVERIAQIGFWRMDLCNNQLFWSPEIYRVYGLPDGSDVALEDALQPYVQEHREQLRKALEAVVTRGESYDLELDFISYDGVSKRVRTMGEPEIRDGDVVAMFGVIKDVTERYVLEQELRAAATTDPLTGLPNRRHLEMFFSDAKLDCLKEISDAFALAIIDMDHFKKINDDHGHAAGDFALCAIADRLNAACKKSCFVSRLGGDEFVLIVQDKSKLEDLAGAFDTLLHDLRKPLNWKGQSFSISATIGVAEIQAGGVAIGQVLECADAALYIAKAQGRGGAVISSREDMFMDAPQANPSEQSPKVA